MKYQVSLIALLLLLAAAAGCSDADSGTVTDNAGTTSAPSTETVTEDNRISDNLPEDLDFSGRTLRLLTSETTQNAVMLVEAETGDLLDDAKYRRNAAVMERFDIMIEEVVMDWRDASSTAKNTISAGDDAYDLMSLVDREALTYAAENMLLSFDDLKYNDLSQPYWNKSINDGITIAGKQVLAYSDFNITTYDFTHVLLYNKVMAEQLDLESPYDLVDAGTWTLEKYEQYMSAALRDVNGDGTYDKSDIFGFVSDSRHLAPTLWVGGAGVSFTKDENDIPVYSMLNDRMIALLDAAYNLYWSNGYWYTKCENSAEAYAIFASGGSLFANANFGSLFGTELRAMEADYGIIPYPKYDEAQDTYYTRVEGGTPHVIPTTVGDVDFASAMLEALACESYNTVLPVYYELALKTKFVRDDQSVKILDMMMQNRIYDLADTYFCDPIRDGFVVSAFSSGKQITASTIEKVTKTVNRAIAKISDPFLE